jgi:hypothetical protein
MKGTIVKFVKTANSFFFFLGFVFLSLFVVYQIYDVNFRDHQRTFDSIQVVDENDVANTPIKYKKSFLEKYDDIYIFKVKSNRIVSPSVNSGTNVQVYNMFSSGGSEKYNDFETVNFLFAKVNSAPVLLLESHALVLEYHLITIEPNPKSFNRQFETNKHLFSVILKDDNQDKVLDKKDKINLLASDHNGVNLITIAKDINDYEIIDDNLLLITQFKEEKTIILIYDLETGTSNTLNTQLPISQVSNMTK